MERRSPHPSQAPHPWHPYDATICTFAATGPLPALAIDFRAPLAPDAREALRARLGGPFSIVTACNPSFLGAGVSSDASNRLAHARLVARIGSIGIPFLEATGHAAAGGHEELGLAFALVGEAARAIAIEFGQDAYFEFDGERFAIAPACRADLGRAPLP